MSSVFRLRLTVLAVAFAAASTGCNSVPSAKLLEPPSQPQSARQAGQNFDPGSADFCQETMAKDPAQLFHFSSARTQPGANDSLSIEADVSPQKIDLTSRTGAGATTNHYSRTDKRGWDTALTTMAMSSPWMDRNMARFNMTKIGPENVAGFDAIKYAVDTRHDPGNKETYLRATGLKDYDVVGSLWLTKDTGCILKYAIDDVTYNKNGTVTKTHYEGGVKKP